MKTESVHYSKRPLFLGALFLLLTVAAMSESKAAASVIQDGPNRIRSCNSLLKAEPELRNDFIDELVEENLPHMEKLFAEITKRFPVESNEFVFVGRSPTLLAAYVDVLKETNSTLRSWTMPLSLKSEVEVSRGTLNERFLDVVRKYRTKDLDIHRRLVFIDFVSKGKTFVSLDRLAVDTGLNATFAGFTSDKESAEAILDDEFLTYDFKLFEISKDVEKDIAKMKYVAAYQSLEIEKDDFKKSDMRPGVKSPLYEMTLQAIKRELSK